MYGFDSARCYQSAMSACSTSRSSGAAYFEASDETFPPPEGEGQGGGTPFPRSNGFKAADHVPVRSLCRLGRDEQHRQFRIPGHFVGRTSQEEFGEDTFPLPAHDDT